MPFPIVPAPMTPTVWIAFMEFSPCEQKRRLCAPMGAAV
jgi:hypothetical protein